MISFYFPVGKEKNTCTTNGNQKAADIKAVNRAQTHCRADKTTNYTYDILKRLATVTLPGNVVTTYDYDRQDNLTLVTDAENHITVYRYDDLGRALSSISPDTATTTRS